MVRKYVRVFAILSIIAIMLVGCGDTEQSGASNESNAVESTMTGNNDGTGIADNKGDVGNYDAGVDAPDSSDTVTSTDELTPTKEPEPVHEHEFTSAVTKEATCSEPGETTYSCDCGDTYKEDIAKISHTESDWIVVAEVVGATNGLQHKVCTVCGVELATEEIYPEVVASGKLTDATIEWKIIGTTLYVSGTGAIPDFSQSPAYNEVYPDKYPIESFRDWQPYYKLIEKIVIEDGITKIGKNNFVSFKNTKEVIFSDSVVELGEMAFYGSGLENIDFNNINKLGKLAFSNSHNLKSVVIPGTIKNIPVSCFYYCNNLTEIYIDEGVESISQGALDVSNGQSLTIHLPMSVNNIHGEAYGIGLTIYVKAGSYAETFVKEAAHRESLTVIVE